MLDPAKVLFFLHSLVVERGCAGFRAPEITGPAENGWPFETTRCRAIIPRALRGSPFSIRRASGYAPTGRRPAGRAFAPRCPGKCCSPRPEVPFHSSKHGQNRRGRPRSPTKSGGAPRRALGQRIGPRTISGRGLEAEQIFSGVVENARGTKRSPNGP